MVDLLSPFDCSRRNLAEANGANLSLSMLVVDLTWPYNSSELTSLVPPLQLPFLQWASPCPRGDNNTDQSCPSLAFSNSSRRLALHTLNHFALSAFRLR
jgi:hypothetical protein